MTHAAPRVCTCRIGAPGTRFESRTRDRGCPIHGDRDPTSRWPGGVPERAVTDPAAVRTTHSGKDRAMTEPEIDPCEECGGPVELVQVGVRSVTAADRDITQTGAVRVPVYEHQMHPEPAAPAGATDLTGPARPGAAGCRRCPAGPSARTRRARTAVVCREMPPARCRARSERSAPPSSGAAVLAIRTSSRAAASCSASVSAPHDRARSSGLSERPASSGHRTMGVLLGITPHTAQAGTGVGRRHQRRAVPFTRNRPILSALSYCNLAGAAPSGPAGDTGCVSRDRHRWPSTPTTAAAVNEVVRASWSPPPPSTTPPSPTAPTSATTS